MKKNWWLWVGLVIAVTLVRVATTHRVFSQTFDEPYHLIAAYDVLTKRDYGADPQHPPMRAIFALPFVHEPDPQGDVVTRGNTLLLRNDRYTQNIARARLGNLLFVAIGVLTAAVWGRRVLGPAGGLAAAIAYASVPSILAHGGVATTDMAGAATLPLALLALDVLLERTTWRNTLLLGAAMGFALLSKFSFLMFFPAGALVLFVARRRFPVVQLLVATLVCAFLAWAAYGFTFGTMQSVDGRAREMANEVLQAPWIADIPVPAPRMFTGVLEVKRHDVRGHTAFLLGETSEKGWWYYFPVALLYKTPIAFLLLALLGARRAFVPLLIALAILGAAMTSHINIGVRHVLPLYAPLAICVAAAVLHWRRWIVVPLMAWLVVGVALAHPDYLPWFNALAGNQPERVLNDSNLDWGQDVLRLVRHARKEKIPHITTSLLGTTPLDRIGLPPRSELQALQPAHGYVAISEGHIALGRAMSPEIGKWLDDLFGNRPYRRIGKTIRLYQLP
ncbi:MAG TPA: glycosyltransferase family 39 protein [Thermoanaerobaculia bacterium]|nr:glycosyltransferase family 39 protein [Thermoanaerobaculia bacterium]